MEIFFGKRELQALCNSRAALQRRWGRKRAALLAQRLHELAALDCLADLDHLPHVAVEGSGRGVRVAVDDRLALALVAVDGQPALSRAPAQEVTEVMIEDVIDGRNEQQ